MNNFLDHFWHQIDNGQIVRRIAFFGRMWLTYETYTWAMLYIDAIEEIGADHALILAAILTPVGALQGAVIKFYAENPHEFRNYTFKLSQKRADNLDITPEDLEDLYKDHLIDKPEEDDEPFTWRK